MFGPAPSYFGQAPTPQPQGQSFQFGGAQNMFGPSQGAMYASALAGGQQQPAPQQPWGGMAPGAAPPQANPINPYLNQLQSAGFINPAMWQQMQARYNALPQVAQGTPTINQPYGWWGSRSPYGGSEMAGLEGDPSGGLGNALEAASAGNGGLW